MPYTVALLGEEKCLECLLDLCTCLRNHSIDQFLCDYILFTKTVTSWDHVRDNKKKGCNKNACTTLQNKCYQMHSISILWQSLKRQCIYKKVRLERTYTICVNALPELFGDISPETIINGAKNELKVEREIFLKKMLCMLILHIYTS